MSTYIEYWQSSLAVIFVVFGWFTSATKNVWFSQEWTFHLKWQCLEIPSGVARVTTSSFNMYNRTVFCKEIFTREVFTWKNGYTWGVHITFTLGPWCGSKRGEVSKERTVPTFERYSTMMTSLHNNSAQPNFFATVIDPWNLMTIESRIHYQRYKYNYHNNNVIKASRSTRCL